MLTETIPTLVLYIGLLYNINTSIKIEITKPHILFLKRVRKKYNLTYLFEVNENEVKSQVLNTLEIPLCT